MIATKKLHDDIGETDDIANIASFASANFSMFVARRCVKTGYVSKIVDNCL